MSKDLEKPVEQERSRADISRVVRNVTIEPEVARAAIAKARQGLNEDQQPSEVTISVAVSSDDPLVRRDWCGEYEETLSHEAGAIDLEWFRSGNAPVHYYSHAGPNQFGAKGHVANISNPRIETTDGGIKQLWVDFVFYPGVEDSAEALNRVEEGLLRNVSIGYSAIGADGATWVFKGDDSAPGTLDSLTFSKWRGDEVTLCSLPADKENTGLGREEDGQEARAQEVPSDRGSQEEQREKTKIGSETMSKDTQEPKTPARDETENNERTEAEGSRVAALEKRVEEMQAREERANAIGEFRADALRAGVTEADFDKATEEFRTGKASVADLGRAVTRAMADVTKGIDAKGRAPGLMLADRKFSAGRFMLECGATRGMLPSGTSPESEAFLKRTENLPDGYADNQVAGYFPFREAMSSDLGFRQAVQALLPDHVNLRFENNQFVGVENKLTGRTVSVGTGDVGVSRDFAEADSTLIQALQVEPSVFNMSATFPGIQTRDFRIPKETGTFVGGQAGETDARTPTGAANTERTFATEVAYTYKDSYVVVPVTSRFLNQNPTIANAYLAAAILSDLARQQNEQILLGNGTGANINGMLTVSGKANATSAFTFAPTGGTKGGVANFDRVDGMLIEMLNDNVPSAERKVYVVSAAALGAMRRVQKFEGTNAEALVNLNMASGGQTMAFNGIPVVVDNTMPNRYDFTKGVASAKTLGTAAQAGTGNFQGSAVMLFCPNRHRKALFSPVRIKMDDSAANWKAGQYEYLVAQAWDYQEDREEYRQVAFDLRASLSADPS